MTLCTILIALSLQAQPLSDLALEGVWQGAGRGGTVANCTVVNCNQEQEEARLPAMQFSVNITRLEGANRYHVQLRPGLGFDVVLKNVRISDTKEKFELRHYTGRTAPKGYDYIFEHRRFLETGEERVSIIVNNCTTSRDTQCTVYDALPLTRPGNSKPPVKAKAPAAQSNKQSASAGQTPAKQPPRAGNAPPKEEARKPAAKTETPDARKSGRGKSARTSPQVLLELDRTTVRVNEVAITKTIVSGGVAPYRYQWWYDGNHVSAKAPNIEWTVRTRGKHQVIVQVTDAAGNIVEASVEINAK